MRTRHRLALIALLWLVVASVFAAALGGDWTRVWGVLGVPALSPPFADLRTITGALGSSKLGADPLRHNPMDPWARTMNYPRVWILLFRLAGITDANLPLVGLALSAGYLAALSWLIWRAADAVLAGAIAVCALSGASLLAMERGNNDLLVFVLVLGAAVSRSPVTSAMTIGGAGLLKLYPLAAILSFATARDRRGRVVTCTLIAVTVMAVGVNVGDVPLMAHGTPRSFRLSYGILSLQAGCRDLASRLGVLAGVCESRLPSLFVVTLTAGLAAATAFLAWRSRRPWLADERRGVNADLFMTFGAIYAFTYFTGSNWDYRLIVLIPLLPLLSALGRTQGGRWLGWGGVALVPVAMNAGMVLAGPWTYVGHAAKTALVLVCLFLMVTMTRARWADRRGAARGELDARAGSVRPEPAR